MDRKWLLGLGAAALVVLILAIVVVFGGPGGGPADAAKAFFAAIPSGGTQAAYNKAAAAFRSATTPDAWAATAAQHNLSQYASSSWDDGGKGASDAVTLTGVINLKGGGVQPASVRMVKGAGGWSVYSLDLPSGGVAGANATATAQAAPAGVSSDTGATPVAPTGAPAGTTYGAAAQTNPPPPYAGSSAPAGAQPGYPAAQAGYPPTAYPSAQGQGTPVTLVPGRIAHDCGPHLLNMPGVESIDVHCVSGMPAVPGARGQCEALVNGRPTRVSVTVSSYDPARDDAELDCRLY